MINNRTNQDDNTINKSIEELRNTIRDTVNAYIETQMITVAETIGVLELIKLEIADMAFGSEEEEDDED